MIRFPPSFHGELRPASFVGFTAVCAMTFPGIDGFLGTRASLMLDVVVVALVVFVPLLLASVFLLARRGHWEWHKRMQVALGATLLVVVVLFEFDVRFLTDWRLRARPSPYYDTWVSPVLMVHLFFALSSVVLWILVMTRAWRRFPTPAAPGEHSAWHRRWGMIATADMVMTAVTGWIFYWLAFVSS